MEKKSNKSKTMIMLLIIIVITTFLTGCDTPVVKGTFYPNDDCVELAGLLIRNGRVTNEVYSTDICGRVEITEFRGMNGTKRDRSLQTLRETDPRFARIKPDNDNEEEYYLNVKDLKANGVIKYAKGQVNEYNDLLTGTQAILLSIISPVALVSLAILFSLIIPSDLWHTRYIKPRSVNEFVVSAGQLWQRGIEILCLPMAQRLTRRCPPLLCLGVGILWILAGCIIIIPYAFLANGHLHYLPMVGCLVLIATLIIFSRLCCQDGLVDDAELYLWLLYFCSPILLNGVSLLLAWVGYEVIGNYIFGLRFIIGLLGAPTLLIIFDGGGGSSNGGGGGPASPG